MRGKVLAACLHNLVDRITPAYAGKSGQARRASSSYRDHPRVCGEKSSLLWALSRIQGSPPRMRGKEEGVPTGHSLLGITPAYAGKSWNCLCDLYLTQDHPRVCGEKDSTFIRNTQSWGSPPRMRGKAGPYQQSGIPDRITPAYAGKSTRSALPRMCCRDHPRVCGEKSWSSTTDIRPAGSPPRMRGKGADRPPGAGAGGITPAYAGKSVQLLHNFGDTWDHPRVCGEKTEKIP